MSTKLDWTHPMGLTMLDIHDTAEEIQRLKTELAKLLLADVLQALRNRGITVSETTADRLARVITLKMISI